MAAIDTLSEREKLVRSNQQKRMHEIHVSERTDNNLPLPIHQPRGDDCVQLVMFSYFLVRALPVVHL